jgi:Pvc16 N-terminal domain
MPRGGSAREARGPTIPRMIHEVDELLEKLVKRDALNGSSVELVFDAPTKDWVARRNGPAVDLYLYDIREDLQRRVPAWEDQRDADGKVNARQLPPRRFKLSYLVTAWTQRPEDEHRLLSALLSAFIRNPMIKADLLEGTLAEPDLPVYIDVGQPPSQDRSLADVWSALGGELKPSLDVVVTAPIMVNRNAPIGPLVLEGPAIGLSSSNGATEKVARAPLAPGGLDTDGPPLELVPAGAPAAKPAPGMAIRVRRLRTR